MNSITKILSLLLTMAVLLSACGDDDDDDNNDDNNDMGPGDGTSVDITDPIAVAEAITIENATVVEGDPPAPSTDPSAPAIDEDDFSDRAVATQDGFFAIDIDVESGDVAGTYIQIVGSDTYFDIPFNPSGRSLNRGRTLQDDVDPTIEIEIPENLGVGTFCADVCIYDSETRVSNIVQVCVEITELGGDNSDFLTANPWSAVRFEENDGGVIDSYEVGELIVDTFTETLFCPGGGTAEVEITESDRTNELSITFFENGTVSIVSDEFERDLDFGASDCQNLVYIEDEGEVFLEGTWSYDNSTMELLMVLEITASDFEEEIGEVEVLTFLVEFDEDEGLLVATADVDQDGDGEETIYFEPAQ